MTNDATTLNSVARRTRLIHRLNRSGRFIVCFVSHAERPEVFEFVGLPNAQGIRVRYVNLAAREGANVSVLLQR